MADLSHWDFAAKFSGYEAAALVLGLEPRGSQEEQGRINVVLDRMECDYEAARQRMNSELNFLPSELTKSEAWRPNELISVEMESNHFKCWHKDDESALIEWINDKRQAKFENQEFSRPAITRWLSAIGMKSIYLFEGGNSDPVSTPAVRWPWGNHHTEMLGHLEAAARRFWVGYDPADLTTANTNATVSEWLQSERGVSKSMSDSIASMLRPDGLPTGPRK